MTTNDHTISNPVVEAIGRISLGGSVIPQGWCKALKLPSGKTDLTAITRSESSEEPTDFPSRLNPEEGGKP